MSKDCEMCNSIRVITMKMNGEEEPLLLDDAVKLALRNARIEEREYIASLLSSVYPELSEVLRKNVTQKQILLDKLVEQSQKDGEYN